MTGRFRSALSKLLRELLGSVPDSAHDPADSTGHSLAWPIYTIAASLALQGILSLFWWIIAEVVLQEQLTWLGLVIREVFEFLSAAYLIVGLGFAALVLWIYVFRLLIRLFAKDPVFVAVRNRWNDSKVRSTLVRRIRDLATLSVALLLVSGSSLFSLAFLQYTDCAPPGQVVVLTTPDQAPVVRRRAEDFTEQRRLETRGGCRPVAVLVYAPEASAAKIRASIAIGSEEQWVRSYGAPPHLWIPDTTTDYELAAGRGGAAGLNDGHRARKGRLSGADSVMTPSPLVLAVPKELVEAAELNEDPHIDDDPYEVITSAAEKEGIPLARGNPDGSGAALLHTTAWYLQDGVFHPGDAGLRAERAGRLENGLASEFGAYTTERALLCAVAEADRPVAVMTTREALADVREGAGLPGACARARGRLGDLTAYTVPYGLRVDHPIVRVGWGRPSGVQDEVNRFRRFLGPERGRPIGMLSAQVDSAMDAYERSQGETRILLALDLSTSMGKPGRKFDAARTEAVALTERAAANPESEVGLWTFPATRSRGDRGWHPVLDPAPGLGARFSAELSAEAVDPVLESTPLRDVVIGGVEELRAQGAVGPDSGPATLVVVTDGVGAPAGRAATQHQLRQVLDRDKVRVRVLSVGGNDIWNDTEPCDVPQIRGLRADGADVECVPYDPDAPGAAAQQLLNEARKAQ